MITADDRKILRTVLGYGYAKKVLNRLSCNNVTKDDDEQYSEDTVKAVFNARRRNIDIELAIWQVYDEEKAKRMEIEQKRNAAQQAVNTSN